MFTDATLPVTLLQEFGKVPFKQLDIYNCGPLAALNSMKLIERLRSQEVKTVTVVMVAKIIREIYTMHPHDPGDPEDSEDSEDSEHKLTSVGPICAQFRRVVNLMFTWLQRAEETRAKTALEADSEKTAALGAQPPRTPESKKKDPPPPPPPPQVKKAAGKKTAKGKPDDKENKKPKPRRPKQLPRAAKAAKKPDPDEEESSEEEPEQQDDAPAPGTNEGDKKPPGKKPGKKPAGKKPKDDGKPLGRKVYNPYAKHSTPRLEDLNDKKRKREEEDMASKARLVKMEAEKKKARLANAEVRYARAEDELADLNEADNPKQKAWNTVSNKANVRSLVVHLLKDKGPGEDQNFNAWLRAAKKRCKAMEKDLLDDAVISEQELENEILAQLYDQIVFLKYHKPVKNKRESGSNDPKTGWFDGKMKAAPNARRGMTARIIRNIQKPWVEFTFSAPFVTLVTRKENVWLRVTPGIREETPENEELTPPLPGCKKVPLKYRETNKERTCIGKSFASALHFAKDVKTAQSLNDRALNIGKAGNWLTQIKKALKKNGSTWTLHRSWLSKGGGVGGCQYEMDNLTEHASKRSNMVLVVPQANDGGVEHAVVVHRNLIFDAMETVALPLNPSSLARCCGPTGFACFDVVHLFKWTKNTCNK